MALKPAGGLTIWSVLVLLAICLFLTRSTASDSSELRLVSGCTCVDHPLTFRCTAVGPGATIWRGSALNCPSSLNEIQLYHSRFASGRAVGYCNDRNIVAYAVGTTEGRFHSNLKIVNLTHEMNGTTIKCIYDDGANIYPSNSTIISITTETLPPPMNISLDIVRKGQVHFTWDPVAQACSALWYNINASNCGTCPSTTISTSAVCTDIEVDGEKICHFSVSTVVCSDITGAQNNLEIMLSVPTISLSAIDVTPTYENDTNHLKKLTTEFKAMIENTHNDSIISYTINYTDSNTGRSCGNGTVPATSCTNGVCRHEFNVHSSMCPPEVNFTIKMYGTNTLGDGPNSDGIRQDFINNLVKVVANPPNKTITCKFYYKSNGMKSCNATYFDEYCQNKVLTRSASTTGSYAYLDLPGSQHKRYCYMIAANDGAEKVNICGMYAQQTESDTNNSVPNDWVIALSTLFPAILVITVTVLGMMIFPCLQYSKKRKFVTVTVTVPVQKKVE